MTNQQLETKILELLLAFEGEMVQRTSDINPDDNDAEYQVGWNDGFPQGFRLALNKALKIARKTR